uniref:Uncharacterized protein n=1 Tax=Fagus sylvatica TaxID=28930 RepID=A0A2N9GB52_FAGSY
MTVLRELWYCHVAVLSFHASSSSNPPRFPCAYPFLSDFRGQFWRSSGTQNGSCGISSESSRRPLSNDIKFARIGVRTRELWLPEVGVSELFLCTLSDADSGQTGDAIGEPRVPRRSRSHYLSNAPGLADQLVASRKDSAREGGSCAAYFCKVPDLRESELGLVRYGPASRVHRGVFGPFEGSFPIGIPADPDKFLAIREFHVVHGCVFFPMCPGSQINLLRVRKTLCASVATSVGKFPELSAKPYFVGLFSRAWPCTEASFGFARYDLANRRPSECSLCQGSGWKQARSNLGQTSVNPSQTWSTLVKLGQTLGNVSRTFFLGVFDADEPSSDQADLVRAVLVLRADTRENPGVCLGLRASPSGVQMGIPGLGEDRSGCEKTIRGLKWTLIDDQSSPTRPIAANRVVSTVWNLSPNRLRGDLTWELPKLQIGWFQRFGISVQTAANRVVSTVWNLSPNRLRGDLTWGTTQAANRVVSTVWNLSPNRLRSDLTWGLPKLQIGWFQRFGISVQTAANRVVSTVWNLSPNRLRGDLTWELPKLQIGWFQRFGISVQTAANRVVSTVWNLSPNRLRGDLTWGTTQAANRVVSTVWNLSPNRCLTEVVVAEIVAGPHALDSCECMNIEGAMRAPSRWLLLCLLGRSALASHTLGLAIS